MKPNQLYLLFTILILAGYGWVGLHLFQPEPKLHSHPVSIGSLEGGTCLFKSVTGVPCPACGTTRSVVHLAHGNVRQAALINPLGFLAVLFLIITPCWMLYDAVFKKQSLFRKYVHAEVIIKTRTWVYLPMIVLVLINWCWNILKNN